MRRRLDFAVPIIVLLAFLTIGLLRFASRCVLSGSK
jgi:hypothetical protein